MKRPQVDQALAVTKSDLAKAASVRYELTIDQAAAVAEFSVISTRRYGDLHRGRAAA
jgi:hypothetical protein